MRRREAARNIVHDALPALRSDHTPDYDAILRRARDNANAISLERNACRDKWRGKRRRIAIVATSFLITAAVIVLTPSVRAQLSRVFDAFIGRQSGPHTIVGYTLPDSIVENEDSMEGMCFVEITSKEGYAVKLLYIGRTLSNEAYNDKSMTVYGGSRLLRIGTAHYTGDADGEYRAEIDVGQGSLLVLAEQGVNETPLLIEDFLKLLDSIIKQ